MKTAANQKSFADLRLGLFVHYAFFDERRAYGWGPMGMRADGTPPASLNELADALDVRDLAGRAAEMRAEYLILTAWHANMNALYPGAILNRWRPGHAARRDVIRELLDELNPRGIRLMLYVHPSDGHDFPPEDQERLGWKEGPPYARWNEFVNQVFAELAARYKGEVIGYWVDGGLPPPLKDNIGRLVETIHRVDPAAVIVQNGGTNAPDNKNWWAEYRCRELVPYPYRAEAMQTAPLITGMWWANGSCLTWTPELAFQYLVLQSSVSGAAGGVAFATGPYLGGQWEPGVCSFFRQLGEYARRYADSIFGTRPSRAFVTPLGTPLVVYEPRGRHVVAVATESADGVKTYAHVLRPPWEKAIQLPPPDNGVKFRSARLFSNRAAIPLEQDFGGIRLTVPGWEPLDTVIVLE